MDREYYEFSNLAHLLFNNFKDFMLSDLTPSIIMCNKCFYKKYEIYNPDVLLYNQYISNTIHKIESQIYSKGSNCQNDENIQDYIRLLKNNFMELLSYKPNYYIGGNYLENQFSNYTDVIVSMETNMKIISSFLYKRICDNLKQMPVPCSTFPHFESSSLHLDNDENNDFKKDLNILESIINQSQNENNSDNNDHITNYIFTLNELIQFYNIISKYQKPFSFPSEFVLSAIEKIVNFLYNLQNDKNNKDQRKLFEYFINLDSESEKFKSYKLASLILMRLYMMIHKMPEFLIVLLELILIEQEKPNLEDNDDQFSFKNIIKETLPKCVTKRTLIIKNIIKDDIIDFCFNDDENNFILTKEGVFKINKQDENDQIRLDCSYLTPIDFDVTEYNKEKSKIAFCNGILYLFCEDDKTIHKTVVSYDIQQKLNEEKILKKLENAKEHSQKVHPPQKGRKLKSKPKSNVKINYKKLKRKIGKFDLEKNEINLETAQVEIPDFPVISIGAHKNYIHIVQIKTSDKGKTTLLLTNVDLAPNNKIGFDIEEAFKLSDNDKKTYQTKIEIDISSQNINNVFFSNDFMYVCSKDSSIDTFIIYNNGNVEKLKEIPFPFVPVSNMILKMDNKAFLYSLEDIKNDDNSAISITRMNLPDTKYCLTEENGLFLKYPYLQKLSNIVNNCSQLLLNRKQVNEPIKIKEFIDSYDYIHTENIATKPKNQLSFDVSPNEMSCVVQSIISFSSNLDQLPALIELIKDENLKRFFISLIIKICGINLFYDIGRNFSSSKMETKVIDSFKKMKLLILDMYSLSNPNEKSLYNKIIQESMIFTLSIGGKFLFFPDSYDELHAIMNQLFNNSYTKSLFKSFSDFMFSNPSVLYYIDDIFYEILLNSFDEISLSKLFINCIFFFITEDNFIEKTKIEENIKNISQSIKVLFKHIKFLMKNNSIKFDLIIELISYLISMEFNNPYLSLMLEKEFIEFSKLFYIKIREKPGVIECDTNFLNEFSDLKFPEVHKQMKTFESKHPYNIKLFKTKTEKKYKNQKKKRSNKKISLYGENQGIDYIIKLGSVEFDQSISDIFLEFDKNSQIYENDNIILEYQNNKIYIKQNNIDGIRHIKSNIVNIFISRYKNVAEEDNLPLWGFKLNLYGTTSNYHNISNKYLNIYNLFLSKLIKTHLNAYNSTIQNENEREFQFILDNNIAQGIKLEDIDNYENNQQNGNIKRGISRGKSRGIDFDYEGQSHFDSEIKKDFLNKIISVKEDISSPHKRFLDVIYKKTGKRNLIKLNEQLMHILDIEHYFEACLFKQLGLITSCMEFMNTINMRKEDELNNIKIPIRISLIWKYVYNLRSKLRLQYQKLQTDTNCQNMKSGENLYTKELEEIKKKCLLLLYSDPILKFNDKKDLDNDAFESVTKSIFSFITTSIPLSKLSDFIDIRSKRLALSKESINQFLSFMNQDLLFETSKTIFSECYDHVSPIHNFKGVKQSELDNYKQLFGELCTSVFERIFTQPSIATIVKSAFLNDFIFSNKNQCSIIKCSEIIYNMIEYTKNSKSVYHDNINFQYVFLLICITISSQNSEIVEKIISLVQQENICTRSKQLIFLMIPSFAKILPNSKMLLDEKLIFSILKHNSNDPMIIRSVFLCLPIIFSTSEPNLQTYKDFIFKVFKGIGQASTGKNCLFIDDSYQPFTHKQVSQSMISFIRDLYNSKNELVFFVIHEILNSVGRIDFKTNKQEIFHLIGLFASLGQFLSAFEPERFFTKIETNEQITFLGYNPSNRKMLVNNEEIEVIGFFENYISIKHTDLNFKEKEIENILHLHERIINSKYFTEVPNYNDSIGQNEIEECILISTFYSFLSVMMQNKNNASIILNEKNLDRSLSLFDMTTQNLPSNENKINLLSHYLEQAIYSPLYNYNNKENEINKPYQFIRMMFGEIIYNDNSCNVIITDKNHANLFCCNRPIDSKVETYFSIKINSIRDKNLFIGFIDSEEKSIENAFGYFLNNNWISRKSPYLNSVTEDSIMKNDQLNDSCLIKESDVIGCYYTEDYAYLIINGKITPYRISHKSLKSYIPSIFVENDEIEIEILQNVSIVDYSKEEYEFLNMQKIKDDYFEQKDIKISSNKKDKSFYYKMKYENKTVKYNCLIGSFVTLDLVDKNNLLVKENDFYPQILQQYQSNFGIVKNISPVKDNPFLFNTKIESYNNSTLSKDIINIDVESKYFSQSETNFFNLIENRTNTKFGFNSSFDLKSLPEKILNKSNLIEIRNYMKNKTIKENSKSIAIIMSRYLAFIFADYLRYSKSILLQKEGINSNETKHIIKSLAYSIPTITKFKPTFNYSIEKLIIDKFTIFKEDEINIQNKFHQKFNYIIPGVSSDFNISFKAFLDLSEDFISPYFISQLLQSIFEIGNKTDSLSSSSLYELVASNKKIESISPLPEIFFCKEKTMSRMCYSSSNDIIGYIPILVSSIPNEFPCVSFNGKKFRKSSDQASYFSLSSYNNKFSIKWKYEIKEKTLDKKEILKNFKLKFGVFEISYDLPEYLLNSHLSYIQVLFTIFQSETLYEKHKSVINQTILENIFNLSMKKNPLIFPFLKPFALLLSTNNGFSDNSLTKQASESFDILSETSNTLYPMNEFPSSDNELPLIFNLISNLIKIRTNELNCSENDIKSLFEKYFLINKEIFKIVGENDEENSDYAEGDMKNSDMFAISSYKKKKNFRLYYLLYYYSVLLNNEKNLPYPKFLFVHDRIRQCFGGFNKVITKNDIDKFISDNINRSTNSENNENATTHEMQYKSEILNNNFDLECSCRLINIIEETKNNRFKTLQKEKQKEKNKIINKQYKIIIHQTTDDKNIELPQTGQGIHVSFPIEIFIYNQNSKENELDIGESFVFNFSPSKEVQFEYFKDHYNELQDEFKQFISLCEYDDQFSSLILNSTEDKNNDEETYDDENFAFDEYTEMFQMQRYMHISLHRRFDNDEKDKKPRINRNDFKFYELDKIPQNIDFEIQSSQKINPSIVSLRCSILLSYNKLVEEVMINYSKNQNMSYRKYRNGIWSIPLPLSSNFQNIYAQQIIRPASSTNTQVKFRFVNQILTNTTKGETKISITFNRFEQQKYMDQFNPINKNVDNSKNRPLFVQFMEQVDEHSLHMLKVLGQRPFHVELVGEHAIDAGGPAREIFSTLILELMNEHLGIFSYNPNRRHKCSEINQEDLIPNKNYSGDLYTFKHDLYPESRFIYAGALIAICIVSDLPQQMNLASFIWEYLCNGTVSIDNIYDIDNEFFEFIKKAENMQNEIKSSAITDEEFEAQFLQTFEIKNSFDKIVELVPLGSKKNVTKENLNQFIELAKNYRIHEFDCCLYQLKRGFDLIMSFRNIMSILRPNELKLLVCGEPNCSVEQMKNLTTVTCENKQMIDQFWKVIESFTIEERKLFIKFANGCLGLPAPGLKWESNIKVNINTNNVNNNVLPTSETCFSTVTIPFFENEQDLAKNLRVSIKFSGLITDINRIPDRIEELL